MLSGPGETVPLNPGSIGRIEMPKVGTLFFFTTKWTVETIPFLAIKLSYFALIQCLLIDDEAKTRIFVLIGDAHSCISISFLPSLSSNESNILVEVF